MSLSNSHTLKDSADNCVYELLARVIAESLPYDETDDVSRALLLFLRRVFNTWQSIRTLRKHAADDKQPILDAGVLLRVMFDAYLQAEYIVCDRKDATKRAKDYFDFHHVERYEFGQRVMKHDTPIAKKLQSLPNAATGQQRLQREYDGVRARYQGGSQRDGRNAKGKARVRHSWYVGSLADVARSLGKADEYDTLLATFHGCVHSSALALTEGPAVSREYMLDWASTIAVRVARLSVEHNHIHLDQLSAQILRALCKPFF